MPFATFRRVLLPVLVAGSVTAATAIAGADSPATRSAAAAQAVVRAGTRLEASRVKFGNADLYVPTFFRVVGGRYDLVVHSLTASHPCKRRTSSART